jgi:aldehyde:ferredoxin oxidoreductase
MTFGYWGKILIVDLSSPKIKKMELPEEIYKNFLGGSGLGVRLIYELMGSGVDPFGKQSIIGFVPGLLTGIGIPFGNKYFVVGKSPASGTWMDSNAGGDFGSSLKKTGYDGIFFYGISKEPVYLYCGDKVELRDARKLWGKDTKTTDHLIKKEIDDGVNIACIGPAGENGVAISSIISDRVRAAARGGLASVMGHKKLKALAVSGHKKVPIYNKDLLSNLEKEYLKIFKNTENLVVESYRAFGTDSGIELLSSTGEAPCKNWIGSGPVDFPENYKIGPDYLMNYVTKKYFCKYCPVGCGGIVKVDNEKFKVEEGRKPEYETVISFGTLCLNANIESIIKIEDICDELGLDTISTGSAIAFAMECYEKGLIDLKDIKLEWGDCDSIIKLVYKIGRREGIGNLLAEGVKKTSERIEGSSDFAIHAGGMELPMHDPRYEPTLAISYKADPVPGKRHLVCKYIAELSSIRNIFSQEFANVPEKSPKKDVFLNTLFSKYFEVVSSCGICAFSLQMGIPPILEWINSVTGWDLTKSNLLSIGKRILTLKQCFNIREGIMPKNIEISKRAIGVPPLKDGPLTGVTIDIDTLCNEYYKEMGWSYEGKPTIQTLQELGLGFVE